jgi:hypothetical protein
MTIFKKSYTWEVVPQMMDIVDMAIRPVDCQESDF